jgi:hypothetical protein
MARRYCPVCRRAVDEVIHREGNVVVKRCPNCGYVFARYEVRERDKKEVKSAEGPF